MVITILQGQKNRDGLYPEETASEKTLSESYREYRIETEAAGTKTLPEPGIWKNHIETEAAGTKTLLELLRENRIYLDAPCNGKGSCGKCLVRYRSGAPEPAGQEKKKLTPAQLCAGWRLACVSVPKEDCEVCIFSGEQENMAVETGFVPGSLPFGQEGLIRRRKKTEQESNSRPVPGQGDEEKKGSYGVALDIGTTTLAAVLIKIPDGETCGNAVSVNRQRAYGADVISRIEAANGGKLAVLQDCIRKDILELMEKLTGQARIEKSRITSLVIAGNTTMCHLLLGYSCQGLGKAPFTPVDLSLQKKSWEQVFGGEEYRAEVTVLPGISAFVGADLVAGIYSTKLWEGESCALLLDIGTNGEMALFAEGRLFVTSAAAGPAFEGGNISCGMAGVPGAVSHAVLFGRNRMVVKTVGNTRPEGICGSGIIDVVYEMVKHRIVDENGTLQPEFFERGYPVVKERVYFTQEDIRQVQMAKAAIHAGIQMLLREAGVQVSRVERVFLAGGFGTAIDVDKAAGIGLLPKELRRRVAAVGNSALAGAKCCLTEPEAGERMAELAKTAQEVRLALRQEFEETYLEGMGF